MDWLMKAGDLTDVTIVVEAATFPAHRVVLAAHSDYFYRMFTCGMTESRNEDVKIQGIEPEVFQQVSSASKELGELTAGAELHLHREGGDERGGGGERDLLGRQHAADVRPRAADGESWLVRSLSYLPFFACLVMTMWLQVNRLGKLCSLVNCLDLYFFVDTFCDIGEHASLHRKVGNIYPMQYRSFLKCQMRIYLSYLDSASPLIETNSGSS